MIFIHTSHRKKFKYSTTNFKTFKQTRRTSPDTVESRKRSTKIWTTDISISIHQQFDMYACIFREAHVTVIQLSDHWLSRFCFTKRASMVVAHRPYFSHRQWSDYYSTGYRKRTRTESRRVLLLSKSRPKSWRQSLPLSLRQSQTWRSLTNIALVVSRWRTWLRRVAVGKTFGFCRCLVFFRSVKRTFCCPWYRRRWTWF